MSNHITILSDDAFEKDVLQSEKPVLVDFWAEWCSPCKMMAPVLNDLAQEMGDSLTVAKMNVDDNSLTPAKYGIRGIPTLLLFQGGEVKGTKVGVVSKAQLKSFVEENL